MSKRHFIVLLAACLLFVIVFNPQPLYFLSDDWDSLLLSLQPSNILHSFRPLSDASLRLDYVMWQMNGSGFHITNYILHFGCVFCFYQLSKQLLLMRYNEELSANLAIVGSLFFLYYPFHSEAVFWIVGRGAILCTLFGLLSVFFFIKKGGEFFHYVLSLFFFLAALLSYEEAWILPAIITILAFLYRNQNKKKQVAEVIVFWIVFVFYLIGRFYFTQNIIGTPYGSERLMNFNVFFLARNFAAFIFRSFVVPLQSSVVFVSVCVVIALLLLLSLFLYRKKIKSTLLLSAGFFFLSLIPVLPLGIDTHDTESERFLYFPSVFFILSLVQFLHIVFEKRFYAVYLFLLAGLIPLWLSYHSFVLGCIVTKKTVSAIQRLPDTDTLFCEQLPGQYKGAFIFRNGFKSMIHLIGKGTVPAITILSTSELFQPNPDYKTEFDTAQSKLNGSHFRQKNISVQWYESGISISRKPFEK